MHPRDFYTQQVNLLRTRLRALKKKSLLISVLRLVSFILLLTAGYFIVQKPAGSLFITGALILVIFILLVKASTSITEQKNFAGELLFVYENELNLMEGGENAFPHTPPTADHSMHAADLDIFGYRSLFHLLNRTTTVHGTEKLAAMLNEPFLNPADIRRYQQAVKQMSEATVQRNLIIAQGLMVKEKEGNMDNVISWLKNDTVIAKNRLLLAARILLPLFNLASVYFYLETDNPGPLGIGVTLSWLLTGSQTRYINTQHIMTAKRQTILQQYASILKYFTAIESNGSDLLSDLHKVSKEAHHEVFKLSRLTSMLDQRLNLVVNIFLNSFLLYDINCMLALEKWRERNSGRFNSWLDTVGTIEVLNSLSAFAANNPEYAFPVPVECAPSIKAVCIAHPLIFDSNKVVNDFETSVGEKLLLITGSNMSGKSTFLRAVGVNIILAQTGAPVCARYLEFTPMKILSSIRISDSLQENTSYFMAELKRLKWIISELEKRDPALVLIDEVLRGTNSDDKTHGSAALIAKLLRYNCLALFASHDLSLSSLEQTYPQISNYCFESFIADGELIFDYKINRGVARNKNASFLLEKMGII